MDFMHMVGEWNGKKYQWDYNRSLVNNLIEYIAIQCLFKNLHTSNLPKNIRKNRIHSYRKISKSQIDIIRRYLIENTQADSPLYILF